MTHHGRLPRLPHANSAHRPASSASGHTAEEGLAAGPSRASGRRLRASLGCHQVGSARRNLSGHVLRVQVSVEVGNGEPVRVQVEDGKASIGGVSRGFRLGVRCVMPLDRPSWVLVLQRVGCRRAGLSKTRAVGWGGGVDRCATACRASPRWRAGLWCNAAAALAPSPRSSTHSSSRGRRRTECTTRPCIRRTLGNGRARSGSGLRTSQASAAAARPGSALARASTLRSEEHVAHCSRGHQGDVGRGAHQFERMARILAAPLLSFPTRTPWQALTGDDRVVAEHEHEVRGGT